MEANPIRHSVDNSCMQMNAQHFTSAVQESHKHENNLGARSSFDCPNAHVPSNGGGNKNYFSGGYFSLRFASSNVDLIKQGPGRCPILVLKKMENNHAQRQLRRDKSLQYQVSVSEILL